MNVHVAEDFGLIIDGFKSILKNEGIDVVGTSTNGLELIPWLQSNKADIVILDITMPVMNGIEVVEYFKENNIDQKVIIVSSFLDLEFIRSTVGNGAKGYISKTFVAFNIIEALHKVYNGETFFSTDVQELLIKECLKSNSPSNNEFANSMLEKNLSKQELQILLMHAQEYSPQEISSELKISLSTIRSYRNRIRNKLNLSEIIGFPKRLELIKRIRIEK